MKNILSNLGYISKPALIGTVLGVATVAVGVGIVTNFSGGAPQAPKGYSGAALEQYAGNVSSQAESAASGYSKADLEAGMAAAEMQRDNSSVYSLKQAAGTEKFAYSADAAAVDNAQSAQAGAIDSMGAAGQNISAAAAGAVAPADAAAAAERAAKVQAGVAGAETARATLATSKTMSGNFTRSGSTSGSGSAGSGSSYNLPKVADNKAGSAQIPQGAASALPNGPTADKFKSGRTGELGGYNVKAQGEKQGGNGQAFFSTTVGELSNAARYSQAGKKTVYGDASKGSALAQAAFDGSETAAEGVKISGTNVQQGAAQALEQSANSMDMKPKYNTSGLDAVESDIETVKDLQSQWWGKFVQVLLTTIVACLGIVAGMKVAKAGGPFAWVGWVAAGLAAAIGLLSIWGSGMLDIANQVKELKYAGGEKNAGALKTWTIVFASVMTACVGLSFIFGEKIYKFLHGAKANTAASANPAESFGGAIKNVIKGFKFWS